MEQTQATHATVAQGGHSLHSVLSKTDYEEINANIHSAKKQPSRYTTITTPIKLAHPMIRKEMNGNDNG